MGTARRWALYAAVAIVASWWWQGQLDTTTSPTPQAPYALDHRSNP